MNIARKLPCVAIAAVCTILNLPNAASEDGRGLIHSILLNSNAARSYDVLIRHEELHDISPDEYDRSVSFMRLRVDWDNHRFLCLMSSEREVRVGKIPPSHEVMTSGVQWDGTKTFFTNPVGKVSQSKMPFRKVASTYRIPDLRFVGVRQFPFMFYEPENGFSFESMLSSIQFSKTNYSAKIQPDGSSIQLNASGKVPGGGRVLGLGYSWKIDPKSLMPQSYDETIRWLDEGTERTARTRREAYQWQDFDGVFLPTEIAWDVLASRDEIKYPVENSAHLHWFSVNKPIDESSFSLKYLLSLKDFKLALDPVRSGANSLEKL